MSSNERSYGSIEPAPGLEARSPHRLSRFVWPAQLSLMVLGALYALLFHATLPGRLPGEEHYRAVADVLSKEARPGDAVMLFPWWTERARMFVPEGLPVVGYLHSEGDPLRRHPRIWLLSQPELPRTDDAGFFERFAPERSAVGAPRSFGPLTLQLFDNGRFRQTVFTVQEALTQGQVYVESQGVRTPCPRSNDGFQCGLRPHLYVRTEWHEVLYEPRQCIFMHAPPGGARLVLELPAMPIGDEALFEAGYIWEHAVKKGRHFAATEVVLGDAETGETIADLSLPAGHEGFQRAPFSPKKNTALRISVRAQNDDSRQVCIDLSGWKKVAP